AFLDGDALLDRLGRLGQLGQGGDLHLAAVVLELAVLRVEAEVVLAQALAAREVPHEVAARVGIDRVALLATPSAESQGEGQDRARKRPHWRSSVEAGR